MSYEQKNVLRFFVGKNVAAKAAAVTITSYEDLLDGQIACVDESNITRQSLSGYPRFRFVIREGNSLRYSPWIEESKIKSAYRRGYAAGQQQITYWGHNGTSGSMTVANSALHGLKFLFYDAFKTFGNKEMYRYADFTADASASQAEVATGLLAGIIDNFKNDPEPIMRVERTAAGTSLADPGGSSTILKFTKNSTTVTAWIKTGDATSGFTASTVTVGDGNVIQVPSTTSNTFTFDAIALGTGAGRHVVYIGTTAYNVPDAGANTDNADDIAAAINAGTQAIASVSSATVTIKLLDGVSANVMVLSTVDDTNWLNVAVTNGDTTPIVYHADGAVTTAASFELDYPWQGETCYAFEGTTVGKTCGVLTATGNYGLKFSGLQRTKFTPGVWKNYKVRFKVFPFVDGDAVSSSELTYSQVAKEGAGTYRQIAQLEWFAAGNEQNYGERTVYPGDAAIRSTAVSTTPYETISLHYVDQGFTSVTGNSPASLQEITIAFHKDSGQGDQMITTLDGLSTVVLSAFPA